MCFGGSRLGVFAVDSWICQTSTASPAQPEVLLFVLLIMIEGATEEMRGSSEIPDLKAIAREPWLDWHISARAKWRAVDNTRSTTLAITFLSTAALLFEGWNVHMHLLPRFKPQRSRRGLRAIVRRHDHYQQGHILSRR